MSYPFQISAVSHLPDTPMPDTVYVINPQPFLQSFYNERTNRHDPLLSEPFQQTIATKKVGIAGCGGMGGALAQILIRLGVLDIRIADGELFDVSNINRQYGATRSTVGKSKAFETARMLQEIAGDARITVYPMGICPEIVDTFIADCDVVVNEIEIMEMAAPIVLHQAARNKNIAIFDGNSAGFGTHIFKFTAESMYLEEFLGGITLDEAIRLDARRRKGLTLSERTDLVDLILAKMTPELKRTHSEYPKIRSRMIHEGKAPIVATNPPIASGILAQQILFYLVPELLEKTGIVIPAMPGYAYWDIRTIEAKIVTEQWW